MADTCRHGHPRTPDNLTPAGRCLACTRVSRARYERKRAGRLRPNQAALLRRVAAGMPADSNCDPSTLRAVARRGLIVHSGGAYRLTGAGEQALAAATAPVGGAS
jgi:hypothetical protein